MSDQDSQSVFEQDQESNTEQQQTDQQTTDNSVTENNDSQALQVPDSVSDLVGSGKKYSDINSALNSIKPAQEHISKLENDNQELRNKIADLEKEVSARQSVSDVLDKLGTQDSSEPQNKLDPDQIKQLVYGALEEEKIASTAQSNVKAVNDALFDKYGEKAKEKVASKAKELGISVKRMQDMASESPKAVLAYFDAEQPAPKEPATNKTNLSSLDPSKNQPTGGRSWAEIDAEVKRKFGIN